VTTLQKLSVSLGALGVIVLAWRIDLGAVRVALLHVGWGMTLILGQEIVAHLLNALGWRFAFPREDAASFPFGELVRLRVAGDAINYLTPTATLGGELARTAMLRARGSIDGKPSDARGGDVRAVSVIIAKSTQTLAQACFIVGGLGLVTSDWIAPERFRTVLLWSLGAGVAITLLVAYGLPSPTARRLSAWRPPFARRLVECLRAQPERVALSTLMFALAYAWGAFEAYWICHFLLMPVRPVTAFGIEVLSISIDGILFMVPAKIGTQEGGKVAVFAALGLPASQGFAFGVVRHVRELVWAGFGMLLCWTAIGGRRAAARHV
jgi:glycosyltransferase 2 family protein